MTVEFDCYSFQNKYSVFNIKPVNMDSTVPKRSMNPMTIAEMLPVLSGILSKDAMQSLTAQKQPRPKLAVTRTSEKVLNPMTIAELRAVSRVLSAQSPKRYAQGATSAKKKWNSSVKVERKTVNHTANGQMKHNSVKKVLNFQQSKPKIPKHVNTFTRMTMNPETSKFPKPLIKTKKTLHHEACNTEQISGIFQLPETPLLSNKPLKKRITIANKGNTSKSAFIPKKIAATPKSSLRMRVIPDTPVFNESCDASFLQKEKDIELNEGKTNNLAEEQTLEEMTEVSPPVSTPFKEYRNVKEFFNNSSNIMDNSLAYHDNTIMSFDKKSLSKENSKKFESVSVSLCDMLNQVTLSKSHEQAKTELDILLEVERQTLSNLKMIETVKESQMKSLQYVRTLIREKQKEGTSNSDREKTVIETTKDTHKIVTAITPKKSPMLGKPCSITKSCLKSPSYKIPKKSCMRKKVFYKSLLNVSNVMLTPPKDMSDRAISVYLKMKEGMNFLNTPVLKQKPLDVPDTPTITSHNLQMQLNELYCDD